jgi:flagella basal body P-ring formation protein FlgA
MTTNTPLHRFPPTVLLLALAIALQGNLASEAAEIVLRQRVTLQGPVVRLGDVADLSASTDARLQELVATPLLPAPAPGTRKYLRTAQVRDLLEARGISLVGITFHGPERVAIWTPAVRAPGTLSKSKPSLAKSSSANANAVHRAGSGPTSPRHAQRDRPEQVKPTEPTESVVVLVRPVERGMLVRAADVEVRSLEGRGPFRAIRSRDRAVGMMARQSLRPGLLLLDSHIQAPRLVERGETVSVFARTAGIQVRVHAIAKQHGSLGDLIQVETADRRKRFMARVTGLRELEVFATGAMVAEHTTLKTDKHQLR